VTTVVAGGKWIGLVGAGGEAGETTEDRMILRNDGFAKVTMTGYDD
jgi:hypothetical protein